MRKLEREVVVLQKVLSPRGLQCTFLLLVIPEASTTLPLSQWAYMTCYSVYVNYLLYIVFLFCTSALNLAQFVAMMGKALP